MLHSMICCKAKEGGNLRDHTLSAQSDRSFNASLGLALPALTDEEEQRIVRQVEQLRACAGDFTKLHEELMRKRLAWWDANRHSLNLRGPLPRQVYTLVLLVYMRLDPRAVPVVYEDDRTIIWRSTNFCPTLEACRRLYLDTRTVCRAATEGSVQALTLHLRCSAGVACLDPRLHFSRNYAAGIRPYADYCEEQIMLPY